MTPTIVGCARKRSAQALCVTNKRNRRVRSGKAGKQMCEVTFQPPIERTIADTFDSKEHGERDDLTRIERGLRVLTNLSHRIIYAAKQFSDKVLSGHDGSLQ